MYRLSKNSRSFLKARSSFSEYVCKHRHNAGSFRSSMASCARSNRLVRNPGRYVSRRQLSKRMAAVICTNVRVIAAVSTWLFGRFRDRFCRCLKKHLGLCRRTRARHQSHALACHPLRSCAQSARPSADQVAHAMVKLDVIGTTGVCKPTTLSNQAPDAYT